MNLGAQCIFSVLAATAFPVFAEVVVSRSESRIPVDGTVEISPGSAIDFSAASWRDAPAGRHGRVRAAGSRFEFEDSPGVERRFYGVNLCFGANFPTPEVSRKLAEVLARTGYNALRLHHYDGGLVEKSPDSVTINPERMARLDALAAECVKAGIYLTTDLYVSRRVPWREIGIDRDGFVPQESFKERCLFDAAAYSNLCAFSRAFLGHVNPHLGRRWADEPALAWIAFINEGNPGNHGFATYRDDPKANAKWREWLAAKKLADPGRFGDVDESVPENAWVETPKCLRLREFLADLQIDFDRRFAKFLREELGVKALFSNLSSWYNPPAYQRVRRQYDYVDDHFYVDHPRFLEHDWRLPSACENVNPARVAPRGMLNLEKHRLAERPFTVTEFNFSAPGRWRGLGGMMFGDQAARFSYAGVWRFAWSHDEAHVLGGGAIGYFNAADDPLVRATERAAMMLFLAGDPAPASRSNDGAFSVESSRTCGVAAESGRVSAGPLSVNVLLCPGAAWASSLDGKPLAESRRILFTHVTDVQDEGTVYDDAERKILRKWGHLPHLMERGKAEVELKLSSHSVPVVYALAASGTRKMVVPSRFESGTLFFAADTAIDPDSATFLYEITR